MKVILTLTPHAPRSSAELIALHIFSQLCHCSCDVTVRDADGTLLLDGLANFSQLNTLQFKPSLDLIIDARPLISCESSAGHAELEQNDGTFSIQENSRQAGSAE